MKELLPKTWLILLFLACLMSCVGNQVGLERGQTAPDFELSGTDNQTLKLSAMRGKVLMLHFWADFCPSCKREFPETQAFYDKLKKQNFEVIAINVGQKPQISLDFQTEFNATFKLLSDIDKRVAKLYNVGDKMPVNYFIDEKGCIIRRINGWTNQNQVQVILKQNAQK